MSFRRRSLSSAVRASCASRSNLGIPVMSPSRGENLYHEPSPTSEACSDFVVFTKRSMSLALSQREMSFVITPCWRKVKLHVHPPGTSKGWNTYLSAWEETMCDAFMHSAIQSSEPCGMSRL